MKISQKLLVLSSILVGSVAFAAEQFPLNEVQLLDSRYLANKKRNADFLLTLSPDRLMARMYQFCGEPVKAPVYDGWESSDLSGHTLGHYLTALSMEYLSTGDTKYKERVDYIVSEMARCQEKYGESGYIGCLNDKIRNSLEVLKNGDVETINKMWAPWYTQHKIAAGLLDAWRYAGNEQAKLVLIKFANWVDGLTKGLTPEQDQRMLSMEFGGLGETFLHLYAETKLPAHKALAERFRHHWLIDDLAAGRDNLPGKHANTQIPKVVAEAVNYEITGDDFAKRVAVNFFDIVTKNHTYAPGCNSDREQFFNPKEADRRLTNATGETCNVHNMIRLAEHLQKWEPENRAYGDYRERAMINQIIGSQDPERAMFQYFVCLRPGHYHVYSTPDRSFWCCFGTGIENPTKYNIGIYFHDDDTVYVTQYIPSVLKWKEAGFELEQKTEYPKDGKIVFTVKQAPAKEMRLHFRTPGWVNGKIQTAVNGKKEEIDSTEKGWSVKRVWKAGDTVELNIPMGLHAEPLFGGHDELTAYFYGPTLLAGDLGKVPDYANKVYVKDQLDRQREPAVAVPTLKGTKADDIMKGFKAVSGEDRAFNAATTDGKTVLLRPFNQLPYSYYTVYWRRGE